MHSNVLVIGGSGLVGRAVLRRCAREGLRPIAATREDAPETGIADLAVWHCRTDMEAIAGRVSSASAIDTVIGAGPLDGLSHWLTRQPLPGLRRVVALSSTSVTVKPDSPDTVERAIAQRLAEGEARLVKACEAQGVAWTLLRPTLIWGEGRDHNVSRLAAMARQRGRILLPRFARGLRQPIRADDVAAALLAALRRPQAAGRRLELPGGEALPYHVMAGRIAKALSPAAAVWRLPLPAGLFRAAARLRLIPSASAAVLLRMERDLQFDGRPAELALGVTPRGFEPEEDDFPRR